MILDQYGRPIQPPAVMRKPIGFHDQPEVYADEESGGAVSGTFVAGRVSGDWRGSGEQWRQEPSGL